MKMKDEMMETLMTVMADLHYVSVKMDGLEVEVMRNLQILVKIAIYKENIHTGVIVVLDVEMEGKEALKYAMMVTEIMVNFISFPQNNKILDLNDFYIKYFKRIYKLYILLVLS